MNDDKYLSSIISEQLETGSTVVLASIVSMEGSTPRESGTKMVIGAGRKNYGTIGGGLLEATVISQSEKVLAAKHSKFIDINLNGKDTSSEDMICGGKATILLDYITPADNNRFVFRQMHDYISAGKNFYLVTGYTGSGDTVDILGHCLLFSDGKTDGDNILDESVIAAIRAELHNVSSTTVLDIDNNYYLLDPVRRIKTLYCFGAGHVAVPTAHIASIAGFRVVVIDDREEFANIGRFPDAEQVCVIDDYNRALESFEIDNDSFIVILTRGHKFDRQVLEQAVQTGAGYIGMISSKRKRDAVYKTIIAEGIATEEKLETVHSPIGLSIGAETPEEIAVSIVAELISERNKK
jgi:xanthine dehydrogenase accessory factor